MGLAGAGEEGAASKRRVDRTGSTGRLRMDFVAGVVRKLAEVVAGVRHPNC